LPEQAYRFAEHGFGFGVEIQIRARLAHRPSHFRLRLRIALQFDADAFGGSGHQFASNVTSRPPPRMDHGRENRFQEIGRQFTLLAGFGLAGAGLFGLHAQRALFTLGLPRAHDHAEQEAMRMAPADARAGRCRRANLRTW